MSSHSQKQSCHAFYALIKLLQQEFKADKIKVMKDKAADSQTDKQEVKNIYTL